ncbi:MAG: penicillin acylase family protein [Candidatus Binatia bacterium]
MNVFAPNRLRIFTTFLLMAFAFPLHGEETSTALQTSGLQEPVEILTDRWGIAHIYAKNQHDLFFAQGYNAARDRLFQLEVWRRRATGTMAEIQGPKALERDIGARLLRFRGDLVKEMNFYHPAGEEIIRAFVEGVNAYIAQTEQQPSLLPIEFRLLGIKPQPWTPDVVLSRIGGLFMNVEIEVQMARRVRAVGAELTTALTVLNPSNPDLTPPGGLDLALLPVNVLKYYTAARTSVNFAPEDLVDSAYRAEVDSSFKTGFFSLSDWTPPLTSHEGSNNWVLNGTRTLSRRPFMVNDPHRAITAPSLRYWVHLVAPEWNVIGGGEPHLPGISIGHNEHGAWGLTIFPTDVEDLYVYETNPENPNQYRYRDDWEEMKIIRETIPVRSQQAVTVELKYTRHGPVLMEDREHHHAVALQAAWLEIGSTPYLASLRMDQAKTWDEFRDACVYSRAPSENMVWADVDGHIGWQATGNVPRRPGWNGLLPVPGDGRFEWNGYVPGKELPYISDPPQGYWATANAENIPLGYPHLVSYLWEPPFRSARIHEVLNAGQGMTTVDMMKLQSDETSIPARTLIPLLDGLHSTQPAAQAALERLRAWNAVMSRDSVEAGVYAAWQQKLWDTFRNRRVPEFARQYFPRMAIERLIAQLVSPSSNFGADPLAGRNQLLIGSLEQAVQELTERFGPDMKNWRYGQETYHHIVLRHMLGNAVKAEYRSQFEIGPLPRGGDGFTINNTENAAAQLVGASFRIIADLTDWDRSLGVNTPGQSGDPMSPHYRDLTELWINGKYFPVLYSRKKIEEVTERRETLTPQR